MTEVKAVLFWNAELPIVKTESGILTKVKPLLKNAELPILVTESGIMTEVKAVRLRPLNALLPILVTESGIIASPTQSVFPVTTLELMEKDPLEPTPVQATIVAPFAKPGVIKEPDNSRQTTMTLKVTVDFFILFLNEIISLFIQPRSLIRIGGNQFKTDFR